jgi:hypothetical protein
MAALEALRHPRSSPPKVIAKSSRPKVIATQNLCASRNSVILKISQSDANAGDSTLIQRFDYGVVELGADFFYSVVGAVGPGAVG